MQAEILLEKIIPKINITSGILVDGSAELRCYSTEVKNIYNFN